MTVPALWLDAFPDLADLAAADRARLLADGREVALAPSTVLFTPGTPCELYLLVLDGSIRVQMLADTGREIVLYRVAAGQSCLLTAAALVAGEAYAAEGVVEAPTRAVVLPRRLFERLLADSGVFRRFVFAGFGHRVAGILDCMQRAVFHRIERRLARHLAAAPGGSLAVTHQDLAVELGTAREVISRHLEAFERRGLVRRRRGAVDILDPAALARLAAPVD
ncbi:Crp/Fnr family transcriptional regulator [Siculibacillus lacustris]|uniref:Crp/Fnr family transcriptional regulator n=1 Tax=Siculibacillus lacustris TaxID=1549641 RepID=UPI0019D1C339|nr:Crp/Fnr family transcriptional regulator [Siculibacillus lacustris]